MTRKAKLDVRALWRRPEWRFLILFLLILTVSFTVIALQPVNDAVVDPYTGFIARMSGAVLRLFGEEITVAGNLKDMLMNIEAIGSDLEFRGEVAAPTLKIGEMTVGGK